MLLFFCVQLSGLLQWVATALVRLLHQGESLCCCLQRADDKERDYLTLCEIVPLSYRDYGIKANRCVAFGIRLRSHTEVCSLQASPSAPCASSFLQSLDNLASKIVSLLTFATVSVDAPHVSRADRRGETVVWIQRRERERVATHSA